MFWGAWPSCKIYPNPHSTETEGPTPQVVRTIIIRLRSVSDTSVHRAGVETL